MQQSRKYLKAFLFCLDGGNRRLPGSFLITAGAVDRAAKLQRFYVCSSDDKCTWQVIKFPEVEMMKYCPLTQYSGLSGHKPFNVLRQ